MTSCTPPALKNTEIVVNIGGGAATDPVAAPNIYVITAT